MGVHFPRILIVRFLHTRHSASLEDGAFFDQFIDTFRIRLRFSGQSLEVSRLASRNGASRARGRFHPLRAAY